jgi:integrase
VFQSEAGTSINPGNALKRYIRPAAKALGIVLGGFHDFRHTLSTNLRRLKVHPKVVSDILSHKKVNLAMDIYDRTDVTDFTAPLTAVAKELVASGIKSEVAA